LNTKIGPYHVVDLAPGRRIWVNTLRLAGSKHCMYALLEVDVTLVRQFIDDYKARTGETLSFTGFLVFCLAQAADEDKSVQAYLKGRKQLVLFDDVDVGLMVEGTVGGKKALMGHVIRAANHKSYLEIHQEIRSVQSTPVPSGRGMPAWFRSAMLLPWPLTPLFLALLRAIVRRDPTMAVSMYGTVGVTSVGMFGKGHSGWGMYTSAQALDLVVGSTTWKPAVVDGRVEPRQILNLTIVFDHDIIDGAPAARFTRRLVELIESGHGLMDQQSTAAREDEPEAAPAAALAAT
jgi:pyruvate/2-oxoglutarate dehydrogenase complex dihydrolipoamide acyltransferase (E2) component